MTKRWDCRRFDWLDWSNLFRSAIWFLKTSSFQTDRTGMIIHLIVFLGQHPQRCHIFCGVVIRGRSGGFGRQRRESEADKTRWVTQESSLIICGFFVSLRSGEIRAPILLWNDISKVPTDSQICFKNRAKNMQREYFGGAGSASSPWGLISDHTGKLKEGDLVTVMVNDSWFGVKTYLKFEQRRRSCGTSLRPWGLRE